MQNLFNRLALPFLAHRSSYVPSFPVCLLASFPPCPSEPQELREEACQLFLWCLGEEPECYQLWVSNGMGDEQQMWLTTDVTYSEMFRQTPPWSCASLHRCSSLPFLWPPRLALPPQDRLHSSPPPPSSSPPTHPTSGWTSVWCGVW